ncbi:MAG TPA: hypothetical protein PK018_13800 [Candidatus Competibacter sp.]|nr:hypothetical protein [Candidatus Competibacter sp.]
MPIPSGSSPWAEDRTGREAETLPRLAAIQGQLDGFSAQRAHLEQGMRTLTQHAAQQRPPEAIYQSRLQQEWVAARGEIAALLTTVGERKARRQRAGSESSLMMLGSSPAVDSGTSLVKGAIQAISGDRARLRTPQRRKVTVNAGDRLNGLGSVRAVDALQGIVMRRNERVVR